MDGNRAALQRMDCAAGSRSLLHRNLRANPVRHHRVDSLVPWLLQCTDGTRSRTVAGEYTHPVKLIFIFFSYHDGGMEPGKTYIFLDYYYFRALKMCMCVHIIYDFLRTVFIRWN